MSHKRIKLTRTPPWAKGMRKLGPGVYEKDGALHISEGELCEHFGVPYTRENTQIIEEMAQKVVREVWPSENIAFEKIGDEP
jgi:hypothetical protein